MREMFATRETLMRRRQRRGHAAGALACAAVLGAAFGLEHLAGMPPCPLCVVQRLVFAVMGLAFLAAFLHGATGWGRFVHGGLIGLIAAAGTAVAGRHLWLQSLPPEEVPACGPGLDYMLDAFPLAEAVQMVLAGSGECAEVHGLLGVPLPAWTLVGYLLLGAWALLIMRRPAP